MVGQGEPLRARVFSPQRHGDTGTHRDFFIIEDTEFTETLFRIISTQSGQWHRVKKGYS
jgi:hypothetical protein